MGWHGSRREFHGLVAGGAAALAAGTWPLAQAHAVQEGAMTAEPTDFDDHFPIRPDELVLRALQPAPPRTLRFAEHPGPPETWRKICRERLAELLGLASADSSSAAIAVPQSAVRRLRATEHAGVTIEAWVMQVDRNLSLSAYLLLPQAASRPSAATAAAIMAIHGHGEVEPCLGARDDYHHMFALRLAQAGHVVLCPELRGFGALHDMARSDEGYWLDYWDSRRGRQFTLVTDAFLHGRTLIGQTVEDLLRWESWLAQARGVERCDVAGISYGGDLAFTYPVFSRRVRKIYTSGSMGSLAGIFSRCYNAPAHCIPGILRWMDRSDIAGLNAPRPIRLHYGELDKPGPDNASAAYNESVAPALAELRAIYRAFGADADKLVTLRVTPQRGHEIESDDLLAFLAD
ncbi:MAG: hypothetical protein AB1716_01820 [Planctomycetota bacterium]